jgi:membrane protein YdbS with pleckstrin-like domain
MKCSKCSADLPVDARFCPACGASTDAAPTEVAAVAPGAAPPSSPFVAELLRDRADAQRAAAAASPPAENVLWQGTYSPKDMAGTFLTVGVLSIVAVITGVFYVTGIGWLWLLGTIAVVWAALGLVLLYRRMSIRYRLTDQRFFHERGILTRVVDRIEVIDMDDITYVQGIVDRIFGTGTIKVTSSDRTHPEINLRGIDQVREVAALLDSARRQERLRRGVHIEAI